MKQNITTLFTFFLMLCCTSGEAHVRLDLPNREQLSTLQIRSVMQDSEGALWYATEGGGICRDDGKQMIILRNEASHPDLLGSNDVNCIAESNGHMIIGTYHGAYILNKKDYSIRRLNEVDDKKIDDILATSQSEVWLTSNKKIYRYNSNWELVGTYPSLWNGQDVYVAHLYEDSQGRIWATQWSGGLLQFKENGMVPQPWNTPNPPTDIAEANQGQLWIGTVGRGIVRYNPADGAIIDQPSANHVLCSGLQLSADHKILWVMMPNGILAFHADTALSPIDVSQILPEGMSQPNRLEIDQDGLILVACNYPGPFAIADSASSSWYDGQPLDKQHGDRLRILFGLNARPAALTTDLSGNLWYSTGKDIRCKNQDQDSIILPQTTDISAMAFTDDSTLWMSTIYGSLIRYKNGELAPDEYGSNEYGDAVSHMETDSLGRLLMASTHYVRIYDPKRRTMQQQSRETSGYYSITLRETEPNRRWSHPLTSSSEHSSWTSVWWMWMTLAIAAIMLTVLIVLNFRLRRQRKLFMSRIVGSSTISNEGTSSVSTSERTENSSSPDQFRAEDPFIKNAVSLVEAHINDENYGVEQLSSDLCMSRMTFYRRIQMTTGQKPTEFIRTIRLRKAASMLSNGSHSISEICYATGFSSVSYFSRCFRQVYGVPPTQYNSNEASNQE